MRKSIEHAYAKSYPLERILNIERDGEPEYRLEEGGSVSLSDGETRALPSGYFLVQAIKVIVERDDESRARFYIMARFKRSDFGWDFAELATTMNGPDELGGAGAPPPPPRSDAQRILLHAAVEQYSPEFTILSLTQEGEPVLGRNRELGKPTLFFYRYAVTLDGDAGGGKKVH